MLNKWKLLSAPLSVTAIQGSVAGCLLLQAHVVYRFTPDSWSDDENEYLKLGPLGKPQILGFGFPTWSPVTLFVPASGGHVLASRYCNRPFSCKGHLCVLLDVFLNHTPFLPSQVLCPGEPAARMATSAPHWACYPLESERFFSLLFSMWGWQHPCFRAG